MKKLFGIGKRSYNELHFEVLSKYQNGLELLEVAGIFEFEGEMYVNPYSEVSLNSTERRPNGVWYSGGVGCIFDNPDETAKLDYFKFLGLNDEQIQRRKNDPQDECQCRNYCQVFRKCEEQMQHINLPIEKQIDVFSELSKKYQGFIWDSFNIDDARDALMNYAVIYLGMINESSKNIEEVELLISLLRVFVKNDKMKEFASLKASLLEYDKLQSDILSVEGTLQSFDDHMFTKEQLIDTIKMYTAADVKYYGIFPIYRFEDFVEMVASGQSNTMLQKARDISKKKSDLGAEFINKMKSLIDGVDSDDFDQKVQQLKQDTNKIKNDAKLLQCDLYNLLYELEKLI